MRGWGRTVLGAALLALVGAWACGGAAPDEGVDEACAELLPGDLVITEYLNDPAGTDTGQEYVELHNPTRAAVDLRGLTLYAAREDGSQERAHLFEEKAPVASGDYLVLGDVREGPLPGYVDQAYGEELGALGNAAGLLGVRCGERVVDEVHLTAPSRSGVARTYDGRLVPDSAGNDDPERWCDAAADAGTFRGSPGAANAPCGPDGGSPLPPVDAGVDAGAVETCLPAGASVARAVVRPRPGELVITELMANPRGDDSLGEWVEVLATAPVDLNGLTVGSDSAGTKVEGSRCVALAAGAHAVLARRAEPVLNGGLPVPVATFGVDLRNAGGVVRVRAGEVLIDAAVYGPAEEGVATQVPPALATASLNDSLEAWCRATDPYGTRGNVGTPGRVNRLCPPGGGSDGGVPDAGAADAGTPASGCVDRVTGRPRAPRVPDAGSLVITELMADPQAVADATGEWVEVLALRDVDLNGVTLSNESGSTLLSSSLCLSMRAGGRAVLARSEDVSLNGGLPAVLGTFSFNLANSAGNRLLRLAVGGRVLDMVTWTAAAVPGAASQLAPAWSDPVSNDAPGSFCPAPEGSRYGLGDRGTPGMENRPCAP